MIGQDQEVDVGDEIAEAHLFAPAETVAGANVREEFVDGVTLGDGMHLRDVFERMRVRAADHRNATPVLPLHGVDELLHHFVVE